jgi:hypothetical protein
VALHIRTTASSIEQRRLCPELYQRGVKLDFTHPGKPTDNDHISFNGRLRDECLNINQFTSLDDAREQIERWRVDYNHVSCCPTYLCVEKLKDTLIRIACCRVMSTILDAPDELGCGRGLERTAIEHPRSIGEGMLCLDFAACDRQT